MKLEQIISEMIDSINEGKTKIYDTINDERKI